ncbi:hypothetical protein GCM10011614_17360 [Novosphingobium colocasiae]|uniref:Abasic site processing protein n=2 Tax=Novosphingobium colocasiae TaxID=1256513 RepID=A0A918UG10_9SPHN|nr:hypothetical protein GCM10011614_17360 [Novosphingobium colocasiae]
MGASAARGVEGATTGPPGLFDVLFLFYLGRMRIDRLTRLALRVLYDAAAEAEGGAPQRTWGHRLALAWLVERGVADQWQAAAFWRDLAMEWSWQEHDHIARYEQTTGLHGALTNWSLRLGIEPLDPVQLKHLTRRYLPDLEHDSGTPQNPSMCNRYSPGDRQRIEHHFSARRLREFNAGPPIVHPREPGWVVRETEGTRILEQMTWGFPVYLRGKSGQPLKPKPTNNARFDKLGSYWKRWAANPEHRCLIPAAAFAEAVGPAGAMTTTWLSVKDEPLFAWAGLWRETDEWGACYTGVMTDNAVELAAIHDRCPVIIDRQDWATWLHAPLEDLYRFDRPLPADRMQVLPTSVLWKAGGNELPAGLGISS